MSAEDEVRKASSQFYAAPNRMLNGDAEARARSERVVEEKWDRDDKAAELAESPREMRVGQPGVSGANGEVDGGVLRVSSAVVIGKEERR